MRKSLLVALCAAFTLGLAACQPEGPAERTGRKMDNASNSITDTLNPPNGPVESAGRKIDRALGN